MDDDKEPLKDFNDDIGVQNEIYDSLIGSQSRVIKKRCLWASSDKYLVIDDINKKQDKQSYELQDKEEENIHIRKQLNRDSRIQKILQNTKIKSLKSQQVVQQQNEININQDSFNFDTYLTFQQTPCFKKSLQSPLIKFCNVYKQNITELRKETSQKQKSKQIDFGTNPLLYKDSSFNYFYGIALMFKNKGFYWQSLFFYHLAIYLSPFNSKIWEQYCQCLTKVGWWRQSAIIAKTGFFFNSRSLSLGEEYLFCAEKSGLAFHEIRGLLSSLQDPKMYEKIIIESARIQMKNRKLWRGFILLFNYCLMQNFKACLAKPIILLIKWFEAFNYPQIVITLMKKMIQQKPAKYQSFNLYIEITLRYHNGRISKEEIDDLLKKTKNLASETRYRIYLDIAQAVKSSQSLRNKYYKEAVEAVQKNCKEEINKKRAYRHIFMSILSKLSIQLEPQLAIKYKYDDHLLLLMNKGRFVHGKPLQEYQFQDWKYCLHYCLVKNVHILKKYYKVSNQGRVLAEYFHAIRLEKKPLAVLGLWRKKIDECPKSGELWCEGGRIYLELKQYSNAQKCFLLAIHFTPQYGDSFLELLKVFMIENRFLQIHQLFKNFIISQPFYGNVFSYLRTMGQQRSPSIKLSLHEIWQRCKQQIKYQIYNKNNGGCILSCCNDYNQDFINLPNERSRKRLFQSYELIQNKFSK